MERTSQYKTLSEDYGKVKNEAEFYKNRTKQLESLVARVEKQNKQKLVELERQSKSSKQVIEVLDKKLKDSTHLIS